ncbi:5-formyltetrahydrofolate cyclo-ligase [Acinetobacter sp.]|uniref:5-formyltetrahydrofolate cyclo-ligase n=1 Tax=Acinetobacter sp. TaxID=472 RepID=UPI0035B40461
MSYPLNTLRKTLRKQRRAVNPFQQKQAEQRVLNQLIRLPKFQRAQKIGVYLHAFGEIHTRKIMEYCFAHGKAVYLPMICSMNQRLVWVKVSQHQYRSQRFSHHPLGMKEPMAARGLHVSTLDMLLMPLLACDAAGTRIGMGGGFYDKTLAAAPGAPYRLGLAHDFQLVQDLLPREAWDQPLDGLLTPQHFFGFKR